jgi:acetamidase/formamidase
MSSTIHLSRDQSRFNWSRDHEPEVVVGSGTELHIEIADAADGQIAAGAGRDAVKRLDMNRVNPVTGPVYVEGALPGDVLQIDILNMQPSALGWTALIPGFGLLADEFTDPWLHVWEIGDGRAHFLDGITVPVHPMCGVLGVAPEAPGEHSIVPPRRVGGNMDIPQMGVGTTLYLPVEVEGALFSAGDTHAAQGDGEVCGTGIESAMEIDVRLTVRKDLSVDAPEFAVPDMGVRESGSAYACTGIAPDLMGAAKQSIRAMIRHIQRSTSLDEQAAYALCSVAVNLRISQLVDAPNWGVSAFLPEGILR